MIAAVTCKHETRSKHGKDRKGQQRWKCACCGVTIVAADHNRPLGDMRIDLDTAANVLRMLLEGMSVRACERLTGMKRDTICDLVLHVGSNCDAFLASKVKGVHAKFIELDEQWSFVLCKAKTAEIRNHGPEVGDSWTWYGIDSESKLILSHVTGKRDEDTCQAFLSRLNSATAGQTQITSDGLGLYTYNVPLQLGSRISFAQLIKTYRSSQSETRYSPATITGTEKVVRFGEPSMRRVSTSYSERFNLSVRMHNRRCTRLTNAHSKTPRHHAAMHSLWVAYYNFCRKHQTLKKRTPAMAAGLTDHVWSVEELLSAAAQ